MELIKREQIGGFLYKLGNVLAILSVIGGVVLGLALESGAWLVMGVLLGIIDAALMLLISGFGKLIEDVSIIRKKLEMADGVKIEESDDFSLPTL